jgi:hypothetical protein
MRSYATRRAVLSSILRYIGPILPRCLAFRLALLFISSCCRPYSSRIPNRIVAAYSSSLRDFTLVSEHHEHLSIPTPFCRHHFVATCWQDIATCWQDIAGQARHRWTYRHPAHACETPYIISYHADHRHKCCRT